MVDGCDRCAARHASGGVLKCPRHIATYKEVLDAALALADQGLAVFPCHADKRPATPHGFKDASAEPEAVRKLWQAFTAPLIGIATGAVSDLAVLDIDAKHAEAREWWLTHRERLPITRTIRTRSGGLHLWFRHAPGLKCSAGVIAPGIDVRADGGYVIAWHAAGLPHSTRCPTRTMARMAGTEAAGATATAATATGAISNTKRAREAALRSQSAGMRERARGACASGDA